MNNKLSIIVPCLNEVTNIERTLLPLQALRQRGHEIILSDGGSTDNTTAIAALFCDKVIASEKGRAIQMNTGAAHSNGDILLFLHADTLAPDNIDELIISALNNRHKYWGRFNVKLSGKHWLFRAIETLMNLRSCFSGIATGDQGIFLTRHAFNELSGFKNMPLMEDIELSKRLKKLSRPACITNSRLITSSRRWEQNGILKTIFLMWSLRLKYFFGTPPVQLAQQYNKNG